MKPLSLPSPQLSQPLHFQAEELSAGLGWGLREWEGGLRECAGDSKAGAKTPPVSICKPPLTYCVPRPHCPGLSLPHTLSLLSAPFWLHLWVCMSLAPIPRQPLPSYSKPPPTWGGCWAWQGAEGDGCSLSKARELLLLLGAPSVKRTFSHVMNQKRVFSFFCLISTNSTHSSYTAPPTPPPSARSKAGGTLKAALEHVKSLREQSGGLTLWIQMSGEVCPHPSPCPPLRCQHRACCAGNISSSQEQQALVWKLRYLLSTLPPTPPPPKRADPGKHMGHRAWLGFQGKGPHIWAQLPPLLLVKNQSHHLGTPGAHLQLPSSQLAESQDEARAAVFGNPAKEENYCKSRGQVERGWSLQANSCWGRIILGENEQARLEQASQVPGALQRTGAMLYSAGFCFSFPLLPPTCPPAHE